MFSKKFLYLIWLLLNSISWEKLDATLHHMTFFWILSLGGKPSKKEKHLTMTLIPVYSFCRHINLRSWNLPVLILASLKENLLIAVLEKKKNFKFQNWFMRPSFFKLTSYETSKFCSSKYFEIEKNDSFKLLWMETIIISNNIGFLVAVLDLSFKHIE